MLFAPTTFSSADGTYDLYIHFHGNTRVVLESAEHAGLNAMVAVINLGVNSAPYLDAYQEPGSFERLLASIDRAVAARGLAHPHLGRVAVGSWSGGYGAISRIFELGRAGLAKVDAVIVLDGIHCGYIDGNPKELNVRIISPFLEPARRAARGELLFTITHSEIDPPGYAGSHVTADYLLAAVGGHLGPPKAAPEHVELRAAVGAVSKRLEKWMVPTSDSQVGTFHVRGYRGSTAEDHMAHLFQMAATVLPELVARWRSRRAADPSPSPRIQKIRARARARGEVRKPATPPAGPTCRASASSGHGVPARAAPPAVTARGRGPRREGRRPAGRSPWVCRRRGRRARDPRAGPRGGPVRPLGHELHPGDRRREPLGGERELVGRRQDHRAT